jgi:hypothetical protein
MGLLDDAIREHLELKRRHGADASEVAHAEQEALGPVRRQPFERHEDQFDGHAEANDAALAYDDESHGRAQVDVADEGGGPLGEGEGHAGLGEAEYEEYHDEEYYDEEEGEWEEPYQEETFQQPRYGAAAPEPSSADASRTTSTGARRASVPPESAPPTQAMRPEVIEEDEAGLEGEETVEYSVEDAMRSGNRGARGDLEPGTKPPEPGGEDVLEETPEFLQDAPEHDRLWFEQRPPRDFDFDG